MGPGLGYGIGSTAQSLAGYFGQREANRANRDLMSAQHGFNLQNWALEKNWQRLAWNKQNEYDQFLWHQQNKYNSPEEQMARLKAAGLNPHLVFGQGTTGNADQIKPNSPGNSGSPDPVSVPTMRNELQGIRAFSDIYDLRVKKAQENNIDSQTQINALKAIGQSINNANELVKNRQWKFNLGRDKQKLPYELKGLAYSNEAVLKSIEKTLSSIAVDRETIRDKRTFRPLQSNIMKTSVNKMQKEMKVFDARIKTMSTEQKKNEAQTIFMHAQEIGQMLENEMRSTGTTYQDNLILRSFKKGLSDFHKKYWYLFK